jgi:hypothetical protein
MMTDGSAGGEEIGSFKLQGVGIFRGVIAGNHFETCELSGNHLLGIIYLFFR